MSPNIISDEMCLAELYLERQCGASWHKTHRFQLFRQGLFHNSTKAHATIPIGIMGSKSLALLGRGSRCLARRKENISIHVFVRLPCLTPKYLRFKSIKCKTIVSHDNFRHCRVHFYQETMISFSLAFTLL